MNLSVRKTTNKTTLIADRCSKTAYKTLSFLSFATFTLKTVSSRYPQTTHRGIETGKGSKRTGIRKVVVMENLDRNVQRVALHIYPKFLSLSDSSDMCIPKASDTESVMAIDRIPPAIITLSSDNKYIPTIIPRVVITPEVKPNPIPFALLTLNCQLSFFGYIIINKTLKEG